MYDKEQRIKEQRTVEATKKGYMGLTGKLACVAKYLGDKIVDETPGGLYATPMVDVWEIDDGRDDYDGTKIHDSDENTWSREIGFLFDGLSRGMHLEVKYLSDEKTLSVRYRGVLVYRETSGDLECFAPGDWEKHVERLFPAAKSIADSHRRTEQEETQKQVERKYKSFIEQLRLRWGL